MNYQPIQAALDAAKRAETTEFVNRLLDDADFFSDVQDYALEHEGFTPEGIRDMVKNDLFVNDFRLDRIDLEAACRSLNEEFGYERHSKRIFLRLNAYRVDELGRERFDVRFTTEEWSPEDDIDVFLEKVRKQVHLMLRKEGE